MTRSYGENGYEVLHNRMLKSKGATETYRKAIQDMIKNQEELIAERRATHKPRPNNTDSLDEILEVNGIFWNSVGKAAKKGMSKIANFVQSAVGLR